MPHRSSYLDKTFGAQLVVFGFATGRGDYRAVAANRTEPGVFPLTRPEPGSVEALFEQADLPRLALDLRPGRTGGATPAAWFATPRLFRFIDARERTLQFRKSPVARDYDLIIYLDETHATVPLPPR